jgi:hypothetical protein
VSSVTRPALTSDGPVTPCCCGVVPPSQALARCGWRRGGAPFIASPRGGEGEEGGTAVQQVSLYKRGGGGPRGDMREVLIVPSERSG